MALPCIANQADITPPINVDKIQAPDAKWLQYIVHPKTQAADCYRYKLDADDMWNSMNSNSEIHTVHDGEYIGEQ